TDTVVAALTADQTSAMAIAAGAMVGQCDLEGGIDRLGTRVGEEHLVEAGRRRLDQPGGELEGDRMAHVEARGIVERAELRGNRLGDLLATMAGVDAP